MVIKIEWSTFKSYIDSGKVQWRFEESAGLYVLTGVEGAFTFQSVVIKDGGAEQIDFDANYKSSPTAFVKGLTASSDSLLQFTATSAGALAPVSVESVLRAFSLQVVGVPSPATSWSVDLEGSLDAINYSQIVSHITIDGDKKIVSSGPGLKYVKHFRINVIDLTLGSATSLKILVLGVN